MAELKDYYEAENAVILMSVTVNFGTAISGAQAYAHASDYFPEIEFVANHGLPAGNAGVPFSAVIDLETMEVLGRDNSTSDFLDKLDVYHLAQDANDD